jgi:hypothetical protein
MHCVYHDSYAPLTVVSIFLDKSDVTIPLIFRNWIRSSGESDAFLPAAALVELIEPRSKVYRDYRKTHPIPPSFSILDRMLVGASSPNELISALTSHLSRLNGREASVELDFFAQVYHLARPRGASNNMSKPIRRDDISRAIRLSEPLWTTMFALLRRGAKNEALDARGQKNGDLVLGSIIGLSANVIHDCQFDAPDEREGLVALWLRAGLFDALDDAMPQIADQSGMPSMYSVHTVLVFKSRLIPAHHAHSATITHLRGHPTGR